MSALKWGQGRERSAAGPALFGLPLSFDHFVLPRMLRRPVRVLARLGVGEIQPPRFLAGIMSAVLLASVCMRDTQRSIPCNAGSIGAWRLPTTLT